MQCKINAKIKRYCLQWYADTMAAGAAKIQLIYIVFALVGGGLQNCPRFWLRLGFKVLQIIRRQKFQAPEMAIY